jgi:dolichol-phosphate mannosyltransferase
VKWETAPAYLRRFKCVGKGLVRGVPSPWWLVGPLGDVLIFCVAVYFLNVQAAQGVSFGIALLAHYGPRALKGSPRAVRFGAGLCGRLAAVTVLGYCVRGGLLDLCLNGWGWPAQAGIVVAALGTAVLIGPGFGHSVRGGGWVLGSGAGWRAGAMGAVAVLVALRLIYSARVELMPEEAYYWNYARHLDIGYLDHPPLVGWLVQAGRAVFGDGEFGVRIGALCCGAVGTVFIYRLTRHLYGEPSALVAAVLMQALPFFFMSGFLMTPDAPLTAAWAGALYFLERALIGERREGWWGVGVCFGVGMLSKYTIALLGVSTLLFMLSDARARVWFKRVQPYGAVLVAVGIFAPVIVWNARHEWVSFAFQTSRRLAERPEFALPKLVASALVLLTPVGLAGALWVLGRKEGEGEASARASRWLKFATWVPVAVFAAFSVRHEVKLDWTGAPWVALVPGLSRGIVQASAGGGGWIRRGWVPTVVVLMLLYGLGLYDLAVGLPGVGYGKHAELVPVGWRELGMQVAGVAQEQGKRLGEEPLIVGLDRYALASELSFYGPQRPWTTSGNLFGRMGLMYERWLPGSEVRGRALLLVSWDRGELDSPEIERSVERLDPIEQGQLSRNGHSIRPYFYRIAYGYQAGRRLPESGSPED